MIGYPKIFKSCMLVVYEKNYVDYKVCLEWPIWGVPRVTNDKKSDRGLHFMREFDFLNHGKRIY